MEACRAREANDRGSKTGSLRTTSGPFEGREDLPSVVASLLLARDLRGRSEVCETVQPLPEVQGQTGPTGWLDGAAHCRATLDGGGERSDGPFPPRQEWP